MAGHAQTVGQASSYERTYLNPLAKEGYPITEILFPLIVDSQRRVRVKTNWYSAPLSPGRRVTAEVSPLVVSIHHDGRRVAEHARSYARGQQLLNLEHYLDVLERKPGAMAGSTPLAQWRRAGRWPACLDQLWQRLEARHGKSQGTREMITLVRAGTVSGWSGLVKSVEQALSLGTSDAAAVLHLLRRPAAEAPLPPAVILGAELASYERPMPVMDDYDQLLVGAAGGGK